TVTVRASKGCSSALNVGSDRQTATSTGVPSPRTTSSPCTAKTPTFFCVGGPVVYPAGARQMQGDTAEARGLPYRSPWDMGVGQRTPICQRERAVSHGAPRAGAMYERTPSEYDTCHTP